VNIRYWWGSGLQATITRGQSGQGDIGKLNKMWIKNVAESERWGGSGRVWANDENVNNVVEGKV